ncbi:hypothetical protein SISNIDRAFT_418357, partial [Sistotremastrum niveocremeum HHB9708]
MHAVWLKNRSPTRALGNKTPYELARGHKPDLSNLHKFGCRVWVHVDAESKLDEKSVSCRWIGFDEESKGHRIFWP